MINNKLKYLLLFIGSGFLAFALLDGLPYGYFTFLRIIICAIGVFIAVSAFDREQQLLGILYGYIAILYNPLIPIYLTRQIWVPIDIVVGIVFIITAFFWRIKV